MNDNSWKTSITPPGGGWERLSKKVDQVNRAQAQELKFLKITASVLIVSLGLAAKINLTSSHDLMALSKSPPAGGIQVEQGTTAQVPGTPEGIRMYWVFQK